ncbi:uncharacterized protein LOC108733968 [Agrilus planipennis]|uniref:Uncharacterized protein LOC108733968 n=1 Tax=Agrilus planipennis TaxID=224129 RepID=A0A1W4WL47_AGRPL|nr:uncharacterized protein LOC108733968 [Agrilus planipennis]
MDLPDENEENIPRRSSRRSALTEIPPEQVVSTTPNILDSSETPVPSPDELVIVQRGRRRKPVMWSPIDYNKTDLLGPSRDRTPEKIPQRSEMSSKLRRRLVLSPDQDTSKQLERVLNMKLRSLPRYKGRETI